MELLYNVMDCSKNIFRQMLQLRQPLKTDIHRVVEENYTSPISLEENVVELLRQVYIAYGNCLSEKRGNLLILETCDTASDTGNQELHILMLICKLNELVNVWSDGFNTSLHGRYGIGLTC